MKEKVLNLMWAAGAFAPFRMANRGKALIVTYHRFSKHEEARATSALAFSEQLDYLTSRYQVVPLSLIAECLASGKALPARAAAITIDDGYRDAYEVAFPLLRQYRAPATLFVATDFVDRKMWLWTDKLRCLTARTRVTELDVTIEGRAIRLKCDSAAARLDASERVNSILKKMPNEAKEETIERLAAAFGVELPMTPPDDLGPVSWEQAREMDAAGVAIESHTVTHPILINVSETQLAREMDESKARLETELGRKVTLLCYPSGKYNDQVRNAAAHAGYHCAVTTTPGLNNGHSDLLALQRISAVPDLPHFVQSTSGFELIKEKIRNTRSRKPAGQDRSTI